MIMPALTALKKVPNWIWLSGAAVVVLYVLKSGGLKGATSGAVAGLVKGTGQVVIGAFSGLANGTNDLIVGGVSKSGRAVGEYIRDAIGAPKLNLTKCKLAIAQGDNGEAYTYCEPEIFSRWQVLSVRKRLTGKTFTMSDIFN